ncbi:hypothetical protein D3C87_1700280 [compost metagenome]
MSLAAFEEQWNNGFRNVEKPFYITVDHRVPVVGIAFVERAEAVGITCIVDQNIDVFPLVGQRTYCCEHSALVADVE